MALNIYISIYIKINIETASVYLKVSVVKKMRHLKRFSIASKNFILKLSAM